MTRRARPTVAMIESLEEESQALRNRIDVLVATRDAQDRRAEEATKEIRELRKGHDRLQRLVDDYALEVANLRRQQEALIAAIALMESSRQKIKGELEAAQTVLKQADTMAIAS